MSRVKRISNRLWQGALAHVSEDGVPEDVDTVILLAQQVEPINIPVNAVFIYFPFADNPDGTDEYTLERLQDIAEFAADRLVLTICHMGENRSGLLSALIMKERGYTSEYAVSTVQKRGPTNSDVEYSFWNPGFVRQVLELDD